MYGKARRKSQHWKSRKTYLLSVVTLGDICIDV